MDLITHIPGIANSAPFTPGVNTPSPWNVSHTGLTDGSSPNNATKNMAEIYNRILLAHAAIIQDAGLTIDNTNWTQIATALRLLGINHGGACPVTGPAPSGVAGGPPTAAAPYTKYTSITPCFEEWEWFGGAWRVAANHYGVEFANASYVCTAATDQLFSSQTMPRNGKIIATLAMIGGATDTGHKALAYIEVNGEKVAADAITGAFTADQLWLSAAQEVSVNAGDVVAFRCYSGNTQTIPTRGGFRYLN